jgi:hypothetical protein
MSIAGAETPSQVPGVEKAPSLGALSCLSVGIISVLVLAFLLIGHLLSLCTAVAFWEISESDANVNEGIMHAQLL